MTTRDMREGDYCGKRLTAENHRRSIRFRNRGRVAAGHLAQSDRTHVVGREIRVRERVDGPTHVAYSKIDTSLPTAVMETKEWRRKPIIRVLQNGGFIR